MQVEEANVWKKCSSCKKGIGFNSRYYVCSVSTCNGQRTGYVFCSVPCFEVHLPSARHKDAAAIEMRSPAAGSAPSAQAATTGAAPTRRVIAPGAPTAGSTAMSTGKAAMPREVLIIASRLKEYIQARADMNTSGQVMEILSDQVRVLCDRAIDNARADGRKTVMERDFKG